MTALCNYIIFKFRGRSNLGQKTTHIGKANKIGLRCISYEIKPPIPYMRLHPPCPLLQFTPFTILSLIYKFSLKTLQSGILVLANYVGLPHSFWGHSLLHPLLQRYNTRVSRSPLDPPLILTPFRKSWIRP